MSSIRRLTFAVSLAAALAPATRALAQWPPETLTNLQVLDPATPPAEVIAAMRSFTSALGVRCQYCHVYSGDDPDDLTAFEFASDERPAKTKARAMLRMVRTINEELLPEADGELGLRVECETCHRGREHPETLVHLLERELEQNGLEPTIAHYRELRAELYGSGAFDFTAGSLDRVARHALHAGQADRALALTDLNLEFHPDEEFTNLLRAETLLALDRRAEAQLQYQRVLELAPDNAFAAQRLTELTTDAPEDP